MILYKYSVIKKLTLILLIAAMLLTLSACGGSGGVYSVSGEPKIISPENPSAAHHSSGELKSVCKSGLYELFVDETNCSFALKDTAGALWYALPLSENTDAAMLVMDVTNGEETYRLNSQDNSVALGTAKCETTETGIIFSYELSEKKDDPKFKIPVTLTLTLEDGLLNVSTDCKELSSGDSDYKISTLSLVPYFGSVETVASGDFILLPDGSGALIDLEKAEDASYLVRTYGADYAVEEENGHSALLGAFGLKNKTGAYAAIVNEGDAISVINASTKKDGIDNVYASFNITPNGYTSSGENERDYALADSSYTGEVSVCYRFISGSSATYSGLAAMCREQLIRNGMLSTRTVSEETDLPINVTLIGSLKRGMGGTSVYTDFENAEDIAAVLKAKGINALNIKYDGTFSGGMNQESVGSAKLVSKLGDRSAYDSLQSYLSTQGFNLYFTVNLITSASGGSSAEGVINNKIEIARTNPYYGYLGSETFDYKGISSSKLASNVVDFMNEMKDYSVPGYCIGDAGSLLFSDCAGDFVSRQALSDSVFSQAIALSTNKRLMVENGNLYTLKNALMISNIPLGASYDESAAYTSVPFVQMILHGTVEYSGGYFNLTEDYNTLLLRSIEYGALPAYVWTYNDYVPKGADSSLMFYDNWTANALEVYTSFNEALGDLRGAKMTGHRLIQENLYCTEYNNETFIYVNYSEEDITYNNLTVKAGGYLRVN